MTAACAHEDGISTPLGRYLRSGLHGRHTYCPVGSFFATAPVSTPLGSGTPIVASTSMSPRVSPSMRESQGLNAGSHPETARRAALGAVLAVNIGATRAMNAPATASLPGRG
jgi:hypothetical protein